VSKETYVYQKETYIHQPRPSNDVVNSAATFDASAAQSKINNERFDLPHISRASPVKWHSTHNKSIHSSITFDATAAHPKMGGEKANFRRVTSIVWCHRLEMCATFQQ